MQDTAAVPLPPYPLPHKETLYEILPILSNPNHHHNYFDVSA